jgi:hypothetical protein
MKLRLVREELRAELLIVNGGRRGVAAGREILLEALLALRRVEDGFLHVVPRALGVDRLHLGGRQLGGDLGQRLLDDVRRLVGAGEHAVRLAERLQLVLLPQQLGGALLLFGGENGEHFAAAAVALLGLVFDVGVDEGGDDALGVLAVRRVELHAEQLVLLADVQRQRVLEEREGVVLSTKVLSSRMPGVPSVIAMTGVEDITSFCVKRNVSLSCVCFVSSVIIRRTDLLHEELRVSGVVTRREDQVTDREHHADRRRPRDHRALTPDDLEDRILALLGAAERAVWPCRLGVSAGEDSTTARLLPLC